MTQQGRFINQAYLKTRRCNLRHNQTEVETILWYKIKNKQLDCKFRRQYSIERYIVDFYCHELKLIIELDGETHTDEKWLGYDKHRQKYLEKFGYTVIRYTNEQVNNNLDGVLTDLLNKIQRLNLTKDPTLPPLKGEENEKDS